MKSASCLTNGVAGRYVIKQLAARLGAVRRCACGDGIGGLCSSRDYRNMRTTPMMVGLDGTTLGTGLNLE
jgi:hypothetical protein